MSKVHLCEKCPRIPADIKHKLNIFRTDCRRAIKGKEYWSEHIISLGVYEDPVDNCLRVNRNGLPKVVKNSSNAGRSRSEPPNEGIQKQQPASKATKVPEEDESSASAERDARDDVAVKKHKPNKHHHKLPVQSDSYKREQTAINAVLGVRAKPRLPIHRPPAKDTADNNDSDSGSEDDDEIDLGTFKKSKREKEKDLVGEADEEEDEEEEEEGSAGSLDVGNVL